MVSSPRASIVTVGHILDHEFLFRERYDLVLTSTVGIPYFEEHATAHIPFLRRGVRGEHGVAKIEPSMASLATSGKPAAPLK